MRNVLLKRLDTYFCLFISLIVCNSTFSQKHEIGAGVGALSYTGDLIRGYDIFSNSPAINGFYRYNFDNVISAKAGGIIGLLRGSEDDLDIFSIRRGRTFSTPLIEASATLEYNFIDYKSEKYRGSRWSPYFFAGLGVFIIDRSFTPRTAIPFGMGVKIMHRRVWTLGMDIGARKTFTDELDNVTFDPTINTTKSYQYGNPFNKDWYYAVNFTLSYTFYKVQCRYPYQPFKSFPPGN